MSQAAPLDDKAEIEALITASYDIISGPAGPRDWGRQLEIFHPDSRQMRTGLDDEGRPTMQALSPDEFARSAGPVLAETDFYERALVNRIEIFGNIAQAWASYVTCSHPDEAANGQRGINAFLFNRGTDGKWRIVSVIWDSERDGLALPADMTGAS